MKHLRILSSLAAQALVILTAAFISPAASAATPLKSGIYSYEDIGATGSISVAFNDKGEIWFHAFAIDEDGHTAELTPEGGKWIPLKDNSFSYNIKSDYWDYTLTGKFDPEYDMLELFDSYNAGGSPFATRARPTPTVKATCSTSWTRRQPLSWQKVDGIQE